jgi:hypothetical protein
VAEECWPARPAGSSSYSHTDQPHQLQGKHLTLKTKIFLQEGYDNVTVMKVVLCSNAAKVVCLQITVKNDDNTYINGGGGGPIAF